MKANELMIGDWVYNAFSEHPCKVEGIEWTKSGYAFVKISGVDGYKCIESLSPIPLTPEILEKNGFVNVKNTQTSTIIYSFRDSLFRIEVYDFNHIVIGSYYTDSSCDIFISSIHELQHALRLCVIKKEIIL